MAKKNKSGKRRNATPKPAISKKNKLNVRQNSNNSSILYQIFFYAVLFSIAANYYGQLENVSQGYIKTEWLKIPVVLNVPILCFCGLILFSLMQLASATEQRMTGGQYLNREPVSREDFEAYGLGTVSNKASSTELYLDVLKRSLVNLIYYESSHPIHIYGPDKNIKLADGLDLYARVHGEDLPANAMSMIGIKRLNNIQECIEDVLDNNVPGDLIETGACKGGATIFMRGVLKAFNSNRKVYVCDTFNDAEPPTSWLAHVIMGWVANCLVSIPSTFVRNKLIKLLWSLQKDFPQVHRGGELGEDEQRFTIFLLKNLIHLRPVPSVQKAFKHVQSNFARYGLLDDQVVFLKGWFSDTIPKANIKKISILRMDGDTYESTIDAMNLCYDKLQSGGYCIVDDYWALEDCKRAVDEYRAKHNVTEEIMRIDGLSCYWQKN
jgi:hypothetical protein